MASHINWNYNENEHSVNFNNTLGKSKYIFIGIGFTKLWIKHNYVSATHVIIIIVWVVSRYYNIFYNCVSRTHVIMDVLT